MQAAPIRDGDEARIAALERYALAPESSEPALDDIVLLAAQICGTRIALLSLVDRETVHFKARLGLAAQNSPRELSFCAHAIYSNGPMVVPDARQDARFDDHPFCLGEPNVIFYAGEPLVTPEGQPIGTLCVIDHEPRELTPDQLRALGALSRQVVAQFELHRQAADLRRAAVDLAAAEAQVRTSRVAKELVQQIMRSSSAESGSSHVGRRELGRRLAQDASDNVDRGLDAFASMGSGRLSLVKSDAGRFVFEGFELLEPPASPGRQPACHFALGYLEGLLGTASSAALGTETGCVAQGRSHCTFHVRVVPRDA